MLPVRFNPRITPTSALIALLKRRLSASEPNCSRFRRGRGLVMGLIVAGRAGLKAAQYVAVVGRLGARRGYRPSQVFFRAMAGKLARNSMRRCYERLDCCRGALRSEALAGRARSPSACPSKAPATGAQPCPEMTMTCHRLAKVAVAYGAPLRSRKSRFHARPAGNR